MDMRIKIRLMLEGIVSETEVGDVYAALLVHSPQTIAALARSSHIERTKIYRLLDELHSLGLVQTEVNEHRQLLHAAPLDRVEQLLEDKTRHFEHMRAKVKELQHEVDANSIAATTAVRFFKERSGVEQLFWNQTKAKTEVLSLLSENMQSHVSPAFFDRWVARCNEKGIVSRSLVDDAFLQAQKKYYGIATGHSLQQWSARKLPQKYSQIPHRTTVYDDVVTYFSWQDGDLFGIEIHNAAVAQTQRQYFELLWDVSTKL